MRELTSEQIYEGIAAALRDAFPSAEIFNGKTLQAVTPGSFNIIPVSFSILEKLRDRFLYSDTFDVVYYPDEANVGADCLRVKRDLQLIFQTITTTGGAKVHPRHNMDITVVDEVLHCVLHFDYHVFARRVTVDESGSEVTDTDLMRVLDLKFSKEV